MYVKVCIVGSGNLLYVKVCIVGSGNLLYIKVCIVGSGNLLYIKVCIVGSGNWGSAIARLVGYNAARLPDRFNPTVNMWVYEVIKYFLNYYIIKMYF